MQLPHWGQRNDWVRYGYIKSKPLGLRHASSCTLNNSKNYMCIFLTSCKRKSIANQNLLHLQRLKASHTLSYPRRCPALYACCPPFSALQFFPSCVSSLRFKNFCKSDTMCKKGFERIYPTFRFSTPVKSSMLFV